MAKEKVMAFRIFSSYDEDKDYTKLDKFHIDAAIFFNGKTFHIFCDLIGQGIKHRGYKTVIRSRKELDDWLKGLPPDTTLMGYNSTKLDYQLLAKAFDVEFSTIDLMDAIGLEAAEALAIEKRRYPLREVARWNSVKQTVLPHFSWLFSSMELFSEWFNERFRGVAKSLCAECEMIARLGSRIRRKGRVRVVDPMTEKGVTIEMDFHKHVLQRSFFSPKEEE